MELKRLIISGGGTGGHIFPAIAIADAIKKRYPDVDILFVGAQNRMEMKRVPEAGYNIVGLDITGFDRGNLLRNITVLWRLCKSMLKARTILKKFKPQIVIGVGGYASGPTLKVANWLHIPTVIQEQNSYAGVTNKFLAKKASRICVAYDNMERFFPKDKIILTGNPCRQDLMNPAITKQEAVVFFDLDTTKKTILIIGGSLGAQTINRSLSKDIEKIAGTNIQIIWQCGARYITELTLRMEAAGNPSNIRLHDFISRMDLAYKVADLVISRAGASSISELSLLEKPVILIPSPNVAEDHQTKNAHALVEKDAAILITDKDANDTLVSTALEIVQDENKLKELSQNIAKLAQRNSAERILNEIEQVISKR